MKVINNQGKIIEVTEKAYEVLYKSKGFKVVEENDLKKGSYSRDFKGGNNKTLEDAKTSVIRDKLEQKTNRELKDILDKYNVEYTTKMNKKQLVQKIIDNME